MKGEGNGTFLHRPEHWVKIAYCHHWILQVQHFQWDCIVTYHLFFKLNFSGCPITQDIFWSLPNLKKSINDNTQKQLKRFSWSPDSFSFPNHGNSKLCLVFKGQKVLEEKCEKGTKVRSALNMKYNTYITLMSDRQSCKTSSIETFHDGWEARE